MKIPGFAALLPTLAALPWFLGCTPPAPQNLVLISIDTLVPERMSTYGNPRKTTPSIDGLAGGGLTFTRAYSPSSWTLPAHAAMLTGRYPVSLAPDPGDLRLYHAAPLLSVLFRAQGYRTAAVTGGAFVGAAFGANRGFDFFEEFDLEVSGTGSARSAVNWLEQNGDAPFFLFFHTYLPHAIYEDRRFAAGLPPGRFEEVFASVGDPIGTALCCTGGIDPTPAEREFLLALYDSNIAAADEEVADLLAALERLDVDERTTIVVTSDHGEEFWQHTGLAARHGHTLYDELLRIPLIWHEPGLAAAGTRCDASVSLVDLVPTFVARFGLTPPAHVDGIDLSALLENCARTGERVLFAEGLRKGSSYSVRTARGKLIETLEPVATVAPRELYLADDTGEKYNAIEERPELAAELDLLLRTHRSEPAAVPARPATPTLDETTRKRLEDLGYIQ